MTDKTTALVTGASSGIGAAIATVLAERKYDLVLTARRGERLNALKAELGAAHGVSIDVIALDLGVPGGADALYERTRALGKPIGILVNNAGFGVYGPSLQADDAALRGMLELNVVALTLLTHAFGRDMVKAGAGRILQVASVAAFQPSPLYAAYAATKAYVLSLSVAMQHELAGSGVTITTMNPGLTESEFHERAAHIKPKSMDWMYMTARQVAQIGVDAMLAGRAVVTPGVLNKVAGTSVKWVPRGVAAAIAGSMMKGRREPS
jgi:short-subunit dehydrogenase